MITTTVVSWIQQGMWYKIHLASQELDKGSNEKKIAPGKIFSEVTPPIQGKFLWKCLTDFYPCNQWKWIASYTRYLLEYVGEPRHPLHIFCQHHCIVCQQQYGSPLAIGGGDFQIGSQIASTNRALMESGLTSLPNCTDIYLKFWGRFYYRSARWYDKFSCNHPEHLITWIKWNYSKKYWQQEWGSGEYGVRYRGGGWPQWELFGNTGIYSHCCD